MLNGAIRWQILKSTTVLLGNIALALTVFDIFTFEIFDHENQVKVKEYNIRNDVIPLQMLKSTSVTSFSFALAFTVFEILTFEG